MLGDRPFFRDVGFRIFGVGVSLVTSLFVLSPLVTSLAAMTSRHMAIRCKTTATRDWKTKQDRI